MCELILGKDKCNEDWPFTTFHKDGAVRIQHRPLSHVVRSCGTTRHSPFPSSTMLPLTLLLDHLRRAEPTMNGLNQWTSPQPLLNILRPSPRQGRNTSLNLWPRTPASVTPSEVAWLPRVWPHPLTSDGSRLGTVGPRRATRRCPIPHGTASPDAVPQRRDRLATCQAYCNSYSLSGQGCRAESLAGHPVSLELEQERAGVRFKVFLSVRC